MIKVSHLTKEIPGGPTVLKNISFEIYPGEFVAIIGGSGSGKTMLLKCLALQEKWTRGSYSVDRVDVLANFFAGRSKIKREFAYLEEKPQLTARKSALKNVLIGTRQQTPLWRMLTGMVRNDDYMGAMDTIEKLGLLDKAHLKAEHMSGGERQRIAIARALVHGASTLLADEPVSGLDPHAAEQILTDLKALCVNQHLTVIAVLHHTEWAERFADRIIGLSKGEIALDLRGRRLTQREKQLL